MKLSSKRAYFVTIDYVFGIVKDKVAAKELQEHISSHPNVKITEDMRLGVVNIESGKLQPFDLIRNFTLSYVYSNRHNNNSMMLYMDYGLIPVFMFPEELSAYSGEMEMLLSKTGLKVFKLPAQYIRAAHTGKHFSDLYLSRMDVAKLLNCAPEDVTIEAVYKEVLKL